MTPSATLYTTLYAILYTTLSTILSIRREPALKSTDTTRQKKTGILGLVVYPVSKIELTQNLLFTKGATHAESIFSPAEAIFQGLENRPYPFVACATRSSVLLILSIFRSYFRGYGIHHQHDSKLHPTPRFHQQGRSAMDQQDQLDMDRWLWCMLEISHPWRRSAGLFDVLLTSQPAPHRTLREAVGCDDIQGVNIILNHHAILVPRNMT